MPCARASGRGALARALVLLVVSVVCVVSVRKAMLAGDGVEYFSMLESFWNHATPDQRPGDIESLRRVLGAHGDTLSYAHGGLFVTFDGRWFSYHFWIYPLLAVPAKAVLHAVGGDEFRALAWTNAALLVATVAWALRGKDTPPASRLVLLALSLCGPVLWYLRWPHGEVLTWACVVTSLISFDEHRYGRAALLAAIGALQAPPIIMLAGLAVALAFTLGARRGLQALAAASVAALSPAFYLLEFGTPNLIVKTGLADPHLASPARAFSLAFDLDQGMLPWVPATLLLGLVGLASALRARRWRALGVAATALAMMMAASQTTNFNAGCASMNRYDVWIMPLFAWLAAHHIPWAERGTPHIRALQGLSLAGLALQLAIVSLGNAEDDAHHHNALARFVLRNAPSLYTPEPEIFAERTLGRSLDSPSRRLPVPVAFFGRAGATKILVDRESLEVLPDRFDVDRAWLASTRADHLRERGLFFLTPPSGAVRPVRDDGTTVAFADGWYDAESRGGDRWRWMSRKASLAIHALHALHDAEQVIHLVGWVPAELDAPPTLTLSLDGSVIESFTAPRRRFARDFPLPPSRPQAQLTIETTHVVEPPRDPRALGFALLSAEVKRLDRRREERNVHFVGKEWGEAFGENGNEGHCTLRPAELVLDRIDDVAQAELVLGLWIAPEQLGHASRARVSIDGKTAAEGPVFIRSRHAFSLSANERHVVGVELDEPPTSGSVSMCVEFASYGAPQ